MKKVNQILALSLSVFVMACGGSKEEESHEATDSLPAVVKDTTPITVNEETKFKFDFAIANIPSPVGTINEISNWGVDYNSALLNDAKKSSTYNNEFIKAITLGIYNIDLSYAMLNNKGEDVMKLLKTTMVQADALGLKGALDQMIGKRAEQNISNKDSLLKILDEIFVKSDNYLRNNERVYTASILFAGTWVEGLYLTCKVAENIAEPAAKAKAYKHVWDQRFYLNNLMTLIDEYKTKKEATDLNADFKVIHTEISAIKDAKELDDAKFKSISSKIYALREKLVK